MSMNLWDRVESRQTTIFAIMSNSMLSRIWWAFLRSWSVCLDHNSPDTGNLKITRTCTMKIHYFILQIGRRRRNYVFSFKRSIGEPLKIEEKRILAAGICGQLGGPAGICGPRTTPHSLPPSILGAPPRSVPHHRGFICLWQECRSFLIRP